MKLNTQGRNSKSLGKTSPTWQSSSPKTTPRLVHERPGRKTQYGLGEGFESEHSEACALMEELSRVVFDDVPVIDVEKADIHDRWKPFIKYGYGSGRTSMRRTLEPTSELVAGLLRNTHNGEKIVNSRGQTLLYLAYLSNNTTTVDILRTLFRSDITMLNTDGSTVLHAVAWSYKLTYSEKQTAIASIIKDNQFPSDLLFHENARGETWMDNIQAAQDRNGRSH